MFPRKSGDLSREGRSYTFFQGSPIITESFRIRDGPVQCNALVLEWREICLADSKAFTWRLAGLPSFDRFSAILVQGLIPASILRPELTGVLQGLLTTPARRLSTEVGLFPSSLLASGLQAPCPGREKDSHADLSRQMARSHPAL